MEGRREAAKEEREVRRERDDRAQRQHWASSDLFAFFLPCRWRGSAQPAPKPPRRQAEPSRVDSSRVRRPTPPRQQAASLDIHLIRPPPSDFQLPAQPRRPSSSSQARPESNAEHTTAYPTHIHGSHVPVDGVARSHGPALVWAIIRRGQVREHGLDVEKEVGDGLGLVCGGRLKTQRGENGR